MSPLIKFLTKCTSSAILWDSTVPFFSSALSRRFDEIVRDPTALSVLMTWGGGVVNCDPQRESAIFATAAARLSPSMTSTNARPSTTVRKGQRPSRRNSPGTSASGRVAIPCTCVSAARSPTEASPSFARWDLGICFIASSMDSGAGEGTVPLAPDVEKGHPLAKAGHFSFANRRAFDVSEEAASAASGVSCVASRLAEWSSTLA
mmetsp:Transcript_5379/g.11321  ORF Transcript_5379/g.11321 Transcript_5379/m.11321 type:complete len:205 (+) Transcript_5379:2-616(+)